MLQHTVFPRSLDPIFCCIFFFFIKMNFFFQRELAGVHREMPAMHELHGEGDVRIPEDIENIDAELEGDCLKN